MKFHQNAAEVFIPDGVLPGEALARTTHLCIAAHQDDIEIMAAGPILECFQSQDRWFTAVVVTDGRGSPRSGMYTRYDNEEMRQVRLKEQRKAAIIGEYSALVMLDYPSHVVKAGADSRPVEDLVEILRAAHPEAVYTHNLADKHDTHVGVALRALAALRSLPLEERPRKLFGCEVWRDLDWLVDTDKVLQDLSSQENLQAALLGVFDSQISGGKRYDLASLARRRANATYFESHHVDAVTAMSFAMDLTALIEDDGIDPGMYVQGFIERFSLDVAERIRRLR